MKTEACVAWDGVETATRVTEAVCALPAVATVRWCDLAAAAFLALPGAMIVATTIAELDQQGRLLRVEGCGAAGLLRDALALETLRGRSVMGAEAFWTLGDTRAWKGTAAWRADGLAGARGWRESAPGRIWADLGAREVMIGAGVIAPPTHGRVVIVECGLVEGGFLEIHEALLRSTLGPLVNKALRAYGPTPRDAAHALTAREQQILEHLTHGKSVKQIAVEIARSPHTVHDHVKSLHKKLNASSRGQLIARALGQIEGVGELKPSPEDLQPA